MPFGSSPVGYGLQALANVLAGTGQGAQQADVLNQRWTGLGQTQQGLQQHQQLLDQINQSRMSDVPTLFKAMGLQAPPGVTGPMPRQDAEMLLKNAVQQDVLRQSRERANEYATQLERGPSTPVDPSKLGMAAPGATEGFSTQSAPAPGMRELAGAIRAQGAVTPADITTLMNMLQLKQQRPISMAPYGVYDESKGFQQAPWAPQPGANQPGELPFGMRQDPKVDIYGRTSYGAPRAMNGLEHFNASQDTNLPMEVRQRHYDAANFSGMVPYTEGGGMRGKAEVAAGGPPRPGGVPPQSAPAAANQNQNSTQTKGVTTYIRDASGNIVPAPAAPAPQAGPTIRRGGFDSPLKPPGETQVTNMVQADQMINQIRNLRQSLKDPAVAGVMGSASVNPMGAIARRRAQPMNVPIVGLDVGSQKTLTDPQATAIGNIDMVRTQVMRAMEGLRPNSQYMGYLSNALPTANDPNLDAKLASLERLFADRRFIAEMTEGAMRRNAPPSVVR